MPRREMRVIETAGDCQLTDAGYDWDAIRAPLTVGRSALAILGHRSGAALADPTGSYLYWFVRPGTAASWALCDTTALGRGVSVVVPLKRKTNPPGPYWLICPGDGALLTDHHALFAALEDAFHARPAATVSA